MTRAVLLAATVLVLALAGCGGGGGKSAATTTVTKTLTTTNPTGTAAATVTTHGRYKYPEAVTKNYMESCERSSVTRAYCACTLDKLSNNVSTGDFARIGLSGGTIPPRIRTLIKQAALACKDKL